MAAFRMVSPVEVVGQSGGGVPAAPGRTAFRRADPTLARARVLAETLLCLVAPFIGPFLVLGYLLGMYHVHPLTLEGTTFPDGGFLFDLHVTWKAGHDIVTGHSPYPFVYPAPAAFLMVPFGALPWKLAVAVFALFVIAMLFLALRLLGVRDWRCYGIALGSMPATASVTLGALSTLQVLSAAAAWRYRDRRWLAATAIVAAVVTKLFLWPLVIWLVATRRFRTAVTTVLLGVVVTFGCWAMLGFDGLLQYRRELGHVAGVEQARSYSPFALMRSLGMSNSAAHIGLVALTLVAIVAITLIARGPDGDRRSFVAALAAALILSPIVWLHYFVLLYVVIALYQRRLQLAWALPMLYWFLPGQDSHESIAILLWAYAITALTALSINFRPALPRRLALSSP
jgi:Glycosyltransferase family 87